MLTHFNRLSFLLCLTATSACLAADAPKPPVLAVGRCPTPPQIDGKLAAGEWDAAAGSTGLVRPGTHELIPVQPRFWLAFDDQALYFAAAVPLAKGRKPVAQTHERDGKVYSDDSVELHLDPGRARSRQFQFVLNSAGALYDAQGTNVGWNAKNARWAASVTEGQWQVELALPFADIAAAAPTDGARWGANVCLHLKGRPETLGTWGPVKSAFREMANFGELVF
ncbi:MAG: hypothetical protein FJ278_23365, partial [Planctomycetes bacterium]|nr:hypothetical protein [Planctomycetota bacterium]